MPATVYEIITDEVRDSVLADAGLKTFKSIADDRGAPLWEECELILIAGGESAQQGFKRRKARIAAAVELLWRLERDTE